MQNEDSRKNGQPGPIYPRQRKGDVTLGRPDETINSGPPQNIRRAADNEIQEGVVGAARKIGDFLDYTAEAISVMIEKNIDTLPGRIRDVQGDMRGALDDIKDDLSGVFHNASDYGQEIHAKIQSELREKFARLKNGNKDLAGDLRATGDWLKDKFSKFMK